MTLYNKARHLREALDSLLGQTAADFGLVLLDDASADDSEAIAKEYVARDPRVRYHRHAERQAMVATWREVVEIAASEFPSARYFAWASDRPLASALARAARRRDRSGSVGRARLSVTCCIDEQGRSSTKDHGCSTSACQSLGDAGTHVP
jgi:hypothetical protein